MKFFADRGSKRALKLVLRAFWTCEWCDDSTHTLYYYHDRMVCRKCLPKSAVVVTLGNETLYKLVKVKGKVPRYG